MAKITIDPEQSFSEFLNSIEDKTVERLSGVEATASGGRGIMVRVAHKASESVSRWEKLSPHVIRGIPDYGHDSVAALRRDLQLMLKCCEKRMRQLKKGKWSEG